MTPNQRLTTYMRQAGIIGLESSARFYTNNPWCKRMTPRQRRRVLKKAMSQQSAR